MKKGDLLLELLKKIGKEADIESLFMFNILTFA